MNTMKQWVAQYSGVRRQREALAKREEELKKRLAAALEEIVPPDEKGSQTMAFPEPIEGVKSIQWQQKNGTPVIDEDKAERMLKKRRLYDRCTRTVVELDEDEIRKCVYDGLLSQDDFDAMTIQKVSRAFVVQWERS